MIVICLEGCHGCGKTELCKRFSKSGFLVLDEAFLDMPSDALHPQSLLMETFWVCSWFERILRHATEIEDRGQSHKSHIYIADRSPFSAVFYARHGELLAPIIKKQMEEVKSAAGIEIVTVHLKVEDEVLWRRIQERLKVEPGRAKYNEDKKEWMHKVKSFYNGFPWDLELDNTEEDETKTLTKLMRRLVFRICNKAERFDLAVKSCSPKLHEAARKQLNLTSTRPKPKHAKKVLDYADSPKVSNNSHNENDPPRNQAVEARQNMASKRIGLLQQEELTNSQSCGD